VITALVFGGPANGQVIRVGGPRPFYYVPVIPVQEGVRAYGVLANGERGYMVDPSNVRVETFAYTLRQLAWQSRPWLIQRGWVYLPADEPDYGGYRLTPSAAEALLVAVALAIFWTGAPPLYWEGNRVLG